MNQLITSSIHTPELPKTFRKELLLEELSAFNALVGPLMATDAATLLKGI